MLVQCSAVQCSAVQCTTVQCSLVEAGDMVEAPDWRQSYGGREGGQGKGQGWGGGAGELGNTALGGIEGNIVIYFLFGINNALH